MVLVSIYAPIVCVLRFYALELVWFSNRGYEVQESGFRMV